jgi:intracellular multiplication protein IcmQ
MTSNSSDEHNAGILAALNKALEEGPWEESNFLRAVGKRLAQIRDEFVTNLANSDKAGMRSQAQMANRLALRANQKLVYIALYSSEGINLQSWERIVANLPQQTISRPVYDNEVDVKEAIKMKENKMNEGYVAIYINNTDFLELPSDRIPVDKLGKPLLSLKDKAVDLGNVVKFVHLTGTYDYAKGRLTRAP